MRELRYIVRSFKLMALALIVAGGASAQRAGDTYTLNGQTYVVESVNGDRVTLRKQADRGPRRPDNQNNQNSEERPDSGRRPNSREQWATDLPTNVNVAFQAATASASGRDGFISPKTDILKNGTTVALRKMNGNEAGSKQRGFRLEHQGDGWYQISNNEHGVIHLPNNSNSNGVALNLNEKNNSYKGEHQRFRIAKVGNGLYQIYTSHGKNFQVKNTADLTNVEARTGSLTDSNQMAMWRIYTINRGNLTPLN